MTQAFAKESWKSLLPEVYRWLDTVKTADVNDLVSGAQHIVAVSAGSESNSKFEIKSSSIPAPLKEKITAACDLLGWQGKSGALQVIVDQKAFTLLSLCKVKTSKIQIARQLGLDAARVLKDYQYGHLVFCNSDDLKLIDVFDGFATGLFDPGIFKIKGKPKTPEKFPSQVSFLGEKVNNDDVTSRKELVKAATIGRLLQEAPANWLDPVQFGNIAADIAKENKLKHKILGRTEIEELGMGSFLSVAAGSPIEPRLICIEIPGKDPSKTVALVGKGLTFDTGGISIKPSAGMGEMKYDMSGGAAVLATIAYLAKIKPATNVVGIIGAVENMPGGKATRPGDVVVAMNKKTIDIQNTDAEGRLVLADLLHYAVTNYKPAMLIDIATLTGAVLQALGHTGAAIMSNDEETTKAVMAASKACGEPFWELPLWPELDREVKGEISDLVNISKPNVRAGSIIGGIFLKEFVGDTKWAHLDIAGTGWYCKAVGYPSAGGCAYGLRTMSELCLRFES
jgi:leucyl aminopeptidase